MAVDDAFTDSVSSPDSFFTQLLLFEFGFDAVSVGTDGDDDVAYSDDVADEGRWGGDEFDDTSICNGDVTAVFVPAICLERVVKISAFGIKFSKLKWRTSISSSAGSFSFSAVRCTIFIGLKLSAIREKLKLFRLPFSDVDASRDFWGICIDGGGDEAVVASHDCELWYGLPLEELPLPHGVVLFKTPVNADGVARCNSSSVMAGDERRVRLFGDGPCGDENALLE